MDLYFPIANMSLPIYVPLLIGGAVGVLSGLFGIGGGFLMNPLLIMFGVPPTVAVARPTRRWRCAWSAAASWARWSATGRS